jgi:hypothetical protein
VTARVEGVEIGLHDNTLRGVTVWLKGAEQSQPPLLRVERVSTPIHWSDVIFHGERYADVVVDGAVLRVIDTGKSVKTVPPAQLQRKVKEIIEPFRVDRIAIRDAKVVYVDESRGKTAAIDIDDIDVLADNLENRRGLRERMFASVNILGGVYGEGELHLHADFDPYARRPTFKVAAEARGIPLTKLNDLTDKKIKVKFARGSLSLFSELVSVDGNYHGYVKPIVKDARFAKAEEPPAKQIWEGVLESVGKLFENHQKKQLAAKAPVAGTIKGTINLDDPGVDVDLTETIASLMRNAFSKALQPVIDGDLGALSRAQADRRRP